MTEGRGPAAQPPPKRGGLLGRSLLIILTLVSLALGGAIVVGFLTYKSFAKERAMEEARKRGVELRIGDISPWFDSVTLEDTEFRLIGVRGLGGRVDTVDILLDEWNPTRIDAHGVQVELVGSAAGLALEISEWAKNHPRAFDVPVSAKNVRVEWRPAPGDPWLVIEGGGMAETADGVAFTARNARVAGIDVGAVGASWASGNAAITMGFGKPAQAEAPIYVEIRHALEKPTATITLRPTDAGELAGPLGVTLPVKNVVVSGKATLDFARDLEAGKVDGKLEALLDGFVPPHPPELGGFIFGNKTTFTTNLSVNSSRDRVDLDDSRLQAGTFVMRGNGSISRHDTHAAIKLSLKGRLKCSDVADSAAKARVGSALGSILGDAVKRVVEGSVAVRVKVTADTRDLARAEVARTIGVGCGLKPLSLDDLKEIPEFLEAMRKQIPIAKDLPPIPKDLPEGLKKIPEDLQKALPPIPSALPPFPAQLPPFPRPERPETEDSKKKATESPTPAE